MNPRHIAQAARALVATAALLAAASPWAAEPPSRDRLSAGHGKATARCPHGVTHEGGSVCLSKAELDLTRARQAALDKDPAQYMRNALIRCDGLGGDDKRDCVARIQGQGTTSGSVESGGIYRELVTREVGAPPAKAPEAGTPRP